MQPADAALEPGLLVVDRDDDVDLHGRQEPGAVGRGEGGLEEGGSGHDPTLGGGRGESLGAPWELAEQMEPGFVTNCALRV